MESLITKWPSHSQTLPRPIALNVVTNFTTQTASVPVTAVGTICLILDELGTTPKPASALQESVSFFSLFYLGAEVSRRKNFLVKR